MFIPESRVRSSKLMLDSSDSLQTLNECKTTFWLDYNEENVDWPNWPNGKIQQMFKVQILKSGESQLSW